MDTLFPFPEINGPFRGSHALSEEWLTRRQLRSSLVSRMFQDVYVPRGMDQTHALRCLGASLIAPPDAILTGCSAAAVRGIGLALPNDPVEFIVPERTRFTAQRGLNVRRINVREDESEPWGRIRIASPMRMVLDVLTNTGIRKSLPRTVGLLDVLLRAEVVDAKTLKATVETRHDKGIVRARQAVELADPRAESIPESEVRVWLTLGGLKPEVQHNVYDVAGRFLGRLDLAYLERKLAVEYDGEWHGDDGQPERDAARRDRLRAAGWRFVIITKDELYGDPQGMVNTVRSAL